MYLDRAFYEGKIYLAVRKSAIDLLRTFHN